MKWPTKWTSPTKYGSTALEHDIVTHLADAAAGMRHVPAALQYSERAEALASGYSHPLYLAIALRARGTAESLRDSHEAAERLLRRSLEQFTTLGTRWQAGRTWAELGHLEARRGRAEEARDCYRKALALFEAMGAGPDSDQTRQAIEAVR